MLQTKPAKTEAATCEFGSEKRIEDPLVELRRDARTPVADLQERLPRIRADFHLHRRARFGVEHRVGHEVPDDLLQARGIAHIGILKVLEEERIPVRMVAGTSAAFLYGIGFRCA